MDKIQALSNLLIFKDIFDKLGIMFWLDNGTALGAYRDNSFIDDDIDIDMGILSEDIDKLPELVEMIKDQELKYFHLKEHPCGQGKQISGILHGIPFDIYIYYKRGENRLRLFFDEYFGSVKYIPCIIPGRFYNKFEQVDFMDYGVLFNLPSPIDEYLTCNYGNWKVRQPSFDWHTDFKCMDMSYPIKYE
jgi:hypothetical protein